MCHDIAMSEAYPGRVIISSDPAAEEQEFKMPGYEELYDEIKAECCEIARKLAIDRITRDQYIAELLDVE